MTTCQRKTSYPGEGAGPAVEQIDGTWHIRRTAAVASARAAGLLD